MTVMANHRARLLEIAEALHESIRVIRRRGQTLPSGNVQANAARTIGYAREISYRRSLSFDMPSQSELRRVHIVALYLRNKRDWSEGRTPAGVPSNWRNEITGARCSCPNRAELFDPPPANGGLAPCKHILAALALARLEGYRLEEPRS